MKLRNKKTGGLANIMGEQDFFRVYTDAGWADYSSLAELNSEWEDYEEPKQWYGLNAIMGVGFEPFEYEGFEDLYKHAKELGIAFESKEEAERAVEKLKAWKRLRDKGFRFDGWEMDGTIWFETKQDEQEWSPKYRDDLELIFGEEEE